MKRFKEFQKNYDQAIELINRILKGPDSIKELANWLITTEHNPYSFLPENYAVGFRSAEGFASLLSTIHHAVEDDGDICFVMINGTPSIRFIDSNSDDLEEKVLSKRELKLKEQLDQLIIRAEKFFGKEFKKTPYVEVLNIKPNEFGPIYDESVKQYEERAMKWEDFKNKLHGKKKKIHNLKLSECFIRLNSDSWPFKKGTEFISTSSDDGMFSLDPYYSGTLELNGSKIDYSFDAKKCDIITSNQYTGKVLIYEEYIKTSRPMTNEEFWEDYYNSPG